MSDHHAVIRAATTAYRVYFQDELLAETPDVLELQEHYGGNVAPVVAYFAPSVLDGLSATETATTSTCPLKGQARYWSFRDVADGMWGYPQPNAAVSEIAGHVAFDTTKGFRVERVD